MQHLSIKATQLCPSSSTTAKNKDIAKLARDKAKKMVLILIKIKLKRILKK